MHSPPTVGPEVQETFTGPPSGLEHRRRFYAQSPSPATVPSFLLVFCLYTAVLGNVPRGALPPVILVG